MNLVIHNTTWVPGHFHMTVGSAVALTLDRGRLLDDPLPLRAGALGAYRRARLVLDLHHRRLIFARGMISAGLEGMPRRTFLAQANYDVPAWRLGGICSPGSAGR
jgi:cytochrome c oxidase subunit I